MKMTNMHARVHGKRFSIVKYLGPVFVLLSLAASHSAAAPGDLDGSFGAGGTVTTNVDPAAFRDLATDIFVQPDGKLLATGTCDSGSYVSICLARYNSDGSPDTTFGTGGTVATQYPAGYYTYSRGAAAALLDDGRILVGGSCLGFGIFHNCVSRYNADGSLDTTWGTGGLTNVNTGVTAMALQDDGSVVVAGPCGNPNDFCVSRLSAAGVVDTSFGAGGVAQTAIGVQHDEPNAVAVQGDGRIVVTGLCQISYGIGLASRFCTARYNTDGSLDTSFDTDGVVVTLVNDPGVNNLQWSNSVVVQDDGRILIGGRIGLVRYNVDGSPDTSFGGGDGIIDTVNVLAMTVQDNDRIVIVDGRFNSFVLSRFNADGSPDTTLDSAGTGTVTVQLGAGLRFGDEAASYAVAIQDDGKIVAAGTFARENPAAPGEAERLDFVVLRYMGDPANQPPVCTGVVPDVSVLTPANHKLKLVRLSGATDPDGDTVRIIVRNVKQDEPVDVPGASDGNTVPDAADGPRRDRVYIRAERDSAGDGRVYRIAFKAKDGNGGKCRGAVHVSVPNGGSPAVNSGTVYNSFNTTP